MNAAQVNTLNGAAYYTPAYAQEIVHNVTGEKVKYMPIQEFVELGLLQEVNRQFFHPLGLALMVVRENLTNEYRLAAIWDSRDAPEGFLFSDLSDTNTLEKFRKWQELFTSKAMVRAGRFGFITQPIGDKRG